MTAMSFPLERSVLTTRLAALEQEFAAGRRQLAELETRAQQLREQLLRINGAARVLEELLREPAGEPAAAELSVTQP